MQVFAQISIQGAQSELAAIRGATAAALDAIAKAGGTATVKAGAEEGFEEEKTPPQRRKRRTKAEMEAERAAASKKDDDEDETEDEDEEEETEETEDDETEETEDEDESEGEEEIEDDDEEEEEPAPAKKAKAPKLTLEGDIIPALTRYSDKHDVKAAKLMLKKFGVKSVRDLPKEKYADFLTAIAPKKKKA